MRLELSNIGKRFQREWIFRSVNSTIGAGERIAILGGNGSGKSTLLQIISGYLTPTLGQVRWHHSESDVNAETIFRHVALCTPYLSLYEDMTLEENAQFFLRFKSFHHTIADTEQFAERIGLAHVQHKQLRHFSSGMRQRVKLGLAILSNTPLLLLDEPSSHLDARAVQWMSDLINDYSAQRTICIATNSDEREMQGCTGIIKVEDFKS